MANLIEGDPDKRDKLYHQVRSSGPIVSLIAYIAGIVYFCLLPHEAFVHRTYISENALLPGLVSTDIHSTELLTRVHDRLKDHYEKSGEQLDPAFVRELFTAETGVESYLQHFNVSNPFVLSSPTGDEAFKPGRNVYAFGRAQRADGTESIVVSAPLYVSPPTTNAAKGVSPTGIPHRKQVPNLVGIAQLFVMAELARTRPYWAKDLLFVVNDMGQFGMQAWINAYYDTKSPFIAAENLAKRGGSIQAALNLEMDSAQIDRLELKLEGANGKLPNLDLFNTVVRICLSTQMKCALEAERGVRAVSLYEERTPAVEHAAGLHNMVRMMLRQATGVPAAAHGYFINHRIEALTIVGRSPATGTSGKRQNYKQNLLKSSRIVESTLRSINNLLERFHQSFFFYLLSSSGHYISIGMYMPAFGLVALPLLVQLVTLWAWIFFRKAPTAVNDSKKATLANLLGLLLPNLLVSIGFGLILHFGTPYFVFYGRKFQLSATESLTNCYLTIIMNILAAPYLINSKFTLAATGRASGRVVNSDDYIVQLSDTLSRMLVLLALLLFVGTLSLLNFALAFIVAVLYVPVTLLALHSTTSRIVGLAKTLATLLACPLVYFALLYAGHAAHFERVDLVADYAHVAHSASGRLYELALLAKVSGIWTYDLVNLFLVPIWAALWFSTFARQSRDTN